MKEFDARSKGSAHRHGQPIADRHSADRKLRALERRLDDGYRRIDGAHLSGQDISTWEDFWIDLLRQYESAADDLAIAA